MADRDFIAEALKDAERKSWEIIGLLTTAQLEAERNGEHATATMIGGVLALVKADINPADEIAKTIDMHSKEKRSQEQLVELAMRSERER